LTRHRFPIIAYGFDMQPAPPSTLAGTDAGVKRAARRRAAWLDALLVFAIAFAYLRLLPDCFNLFDEGVLADAAERLHRGEILYRDIFTYWNPGGFWIAAGLFGIGGTTVQTLRLSLSVFGAASAVAVWRLARDHADRTLAVLAGLAGPLVCYPVWWMASAHWYSTFAAIAATLMMRRAMQPRAGELVILITGLLCGVTFAILQPVGILMATGVAAAFIWDGAWCLSRRALRRRISVFAAGALAPVVAMYVYFAAHSALHAMVYDTIGWTAGPFRASHHVGYGVIPFGVAADPALRVTRTVLMITPPSVCALALFLTAAAYVRGSVQQRERNLFALSAATSALLISNFYLPDLVHLAFAAPLSFAVLAAVLGRTETARRGQLLARIATAVLGVFILSVGVAAVARLRECDLEISTAGGRFTVVPELVDDMREAFAFLAQLPADEPLFVYPYGPGYNFLSAHPNPTPYEYLFPNLPGANTDRQLAEAAAALEQKQVRYILLSPLWGRGMLSRYDTAVERYIREHYHIALEFPRTVIMERDAPGREGTKIPGTASQALT
jgi:4-amino-4-deoxy-L-arabinose transferase-like glycosyltransferase